LRLFYEQKRSETVVVRSRSRSRFKNERITVLFDIIFKKKFI
jgi:hypothetical protein